MVNYLLNDKVMKETYIKPEMMVIAYNLPSIQLLAGSIGANDQNDPSMAPLFDEEPEDLFESGTEPMFDEEP
jgi:hypothetical protein